MSNADLLPFFFTEEAPLPPGTYLFNMVSGSRDIGGGNREAGFQNTSVAIYGSLSPSSFVRNGETLTPELISQRVGLRSDLDVAFDESTDVNKYPPRIAIRSSDAYREYTRNRLEGQIIDYNIDNRAEGHTAQTPVRDGVAAEVRFIYPPPATYTLQTTFRITSATVFGISASHGWVNVRSWGTLVSPASGLPSFLEHDVNGIFLGVSDDFGVTAPTPTFLRISMAIGTAESDMPTQIEFGDSIWRNRQGFAIRGLGHQADYERISGAAPVTGDTFDIKLYSS